MNTDTPETDYQARENKYSEGCWGEESCVPADFARNLERERDALKALLTKEQGAVTISRNGYVQQLERERDEARERADTMFAKHADILDQARRERDEARDACAGKSPNSQDQVRP